MVKRRSKIGTDAFFPKMKNEKLCDVTLAEFADSRSPNAKGRLRKSKNVLSEVRRISTSEDIPLEEASDDADAVVLNLNKNNEDTGNNVKQSLKENNNDVYHEYPLKIWLLLSEYVRPEDVATFSLICKDSLSVVNTPLFWIRLYKRHYRKANLPKCLSWQCLQVRTGLKANVVRALYHFYPLFSSSLNDKSKQFTYSSLIGHVCLRSWIQCIDGKESEDGKKWVYNFKLSNRNLDEIVTGYKKQHTLNCKDNIHFNTDESCKLLKVVCKEYMSMPCLMGMRLRSLEAGTGGARSQACLRFSSAPLSKMGPHSELGSLTLRLEPILRPAVLPWWDPGYTEHSLCPVCRPPTLITWD